MDNPACLWQNAASHPGEGFFMGKRDLREKREKQRQQRLVVGLAIVAGVALVVAGLLILPTLRSPGDIVVPDSITRPNASGTSMGDPNAPVKIDEYADYQCFYCAKFNQETEPSLIREYIATGKVYFTYHDFAFMGPTSVYAAEASRCAADQGKFWDYREILLANQNESDSSAFSNTRLEAFGEAIGLDMEPFKACVANRTHRADVEADFNAGSAAGVESTPSFLVNGQLLVGAQPFSVFQTAIEAELTKAP
jgi:protein-disulfide isomerase